MAKKAVHTVPSGNRWLNKSGGRTISTHNKKSTAQTAGRQAAIKRSAEHVIHKADGSIGAKNSYGNDPRGSKG